jgi:hypothetical protein
MVRLNKLNSYNVEGFNPESVSIGSPIWLGTMFDGRRFALT